MSAAEKAIAALEAELSDLRPRVWTETAAKIVMPISSPLAAVARAAMAISKWWIRPEGNQAISRKDVDIEALHAALDALEAAAEGVV